MVLPSAMLACMRRYVTALLLAGLRRMHERTDAISYMRASEGVVIMATILEASVYLCIEYLA